MIRYSEFRPTQFDSKGLGLEDRQDWLVVGISRNRDSSVLDESNWECALEALAEVASDTEETYETHRFGHWGPGWFELILVKPGSAAEKCAEELEAALADYPILDEDDYSERCLEVAQQVWRDCYRTQDRLAYIKKHRSEFDFHGFAELLGCVRGSYFSGDHMSMAEWQ